jgi:hypothetical protein
MGISQRHGSSLPCAVCSGTKQAGVSKRLQHSVFTAHNSRLRRRYMSNSLGDAAVIQDCTFLFQNLSGLAASGVATAFDLDDCMRMMCEQVSAAVSAAAASIMPVPRCFEIFAADFVVDIRGRPWLLEVCQ